MIFQLDSVEELNSSTSQITISAKDSVTDVLGKKWANYKVVDDT